MGVNNIPQKRDNIVSVTPNIRYYICDICKSSMLAIHCKIKCQNCGYTRDCSDY